MGVESFKEFKIKTDDFFIRHGIKRPTIAEDDEE
jgi:hypothetical protein